MRTTFRSDKLKGKDLLHDLIIDVNVIRKWILKKEGAEFVDLGSGQVAGCCEHGNEISSSTERWRVS
jgi:hypothetical protein